MRLHADLLRPALLLTAALILPERADAQTRQWANAANGLWTDAARWSPADVPDSPIESAVFDVFGSYAVTLLDGDPPIILDEFRVDRGTVTLRADGVSDGTIRVGGNATIGGELRLTDIASTFVDLGVGGELGLLSGSRVLVDGGPLFALSTRLDGGSSTATTSLTLDNGVFADLGNVSVAASGTSLNRAGIDLFDGTLAAAGDLRIANDSADTVGEVVLDNSQLIQSPGSTTVIGRASVGGSVGRGSLAVSKGGNLILDATTINETGSLINNASFATLSGTLDIAGGRYTEIGQVQRDTAGVDRFLISNDGEATFTTDPLTITAGQQLRLDRGTLTSAAGLVIDGSMRVGSAQISTVGGPTTLSTGTLTVEPNSEVQFLDPFIDQGGFLDVLAGGRVVFGSDYSGFGSVGTGSIEFAAASNAGNSIGISTFGGDLTWGDQARFVAELAGNSPTSFDRFVTSGTAAIDGELVVELLDGSGFTPNAGDSFPLLTAASITGDFDTLTLPALSGGLLWEIDRTPTTLTLNVVAPSGSGDFNDDGVVNAIDYTLWRDTAGSTGAGLAADGNGDGTVDDADLAIWQFTYGSADVSAIPEPTALLLAAAAGLAGVARRGRS
ncbi:MAG: dockerin type I domain-containing protein [Planctomycetota bacterium]